jgi:hypothetical protein
MKRLKCFKLLLSVICALLIVFLTYVLTTGAEVTDLDPEPVFFFEGAFVVDGGPVVAEYPENIALTPEQIAKEENADEYLANKLNSAANSSLLEKRLELSQVSQATPRWSGYAALQAILSFKGISIHGEADNEKQSEIRKNTKSIAPYEHDPLPWYIGTAASEDVSNFPAVNILNDYLGADYANYQPFGSFNGNTVTPSNLQPKIVAEIDAGLPVLICGVSGYIDTASHLPGYPKDEEISHWLVVIGYADNGKSVIVADPAKSAAVRWSSGIDSTYTISLQKCVDFVSATGTQGDTHGPKGIIW